MAKLTPAQDKAIQAFGADGEFPKGTRGATIEGIRAAGLIVSLENDGTWDLNPDGRAYLGLAPLPNTATTDEIVELLDAPIGSLPTNDDDEIDPETASINAFIAGFGSAPEAWRTVQHFDRNRAAWDGLTLAEIRKDIATAVPIGRSAQRYAKRHQNHNH